ncbi:MAG TPA: hypothetical protein PKD12_00585 [Nitrospira sp.]|nr:hypothetical protein [Nitrospira sp.]
MLGVATGVCIRAFKLEELKRDACVLDVCSDPNGFLSSFQNDPSLVFDNPNAQSEDVALIIALDGQIIVGRLGLYPGKVIYNGTVTKVYWLSEFSLKDEYKATGAGGMLLLKALSFKTPLLACGAPSVELEKVYLKVGFKRLGPLKRYIYFYDAGVIARRYIPVSFVAQMVSGVITQALAWYYRSKRGTRRHELTYRGVSGFDEAITELFSAETRNRCEKDFQTLNWVLRHNRAEAFEIYDGDELVGYCIVKTMKFTLEGSRAPLDMKLGTLLDYYVKYARSEILEDLLMFCVDHFSRRGLDIFEFQLCEERFWRVCNQHGLTQLGGNRVFYRSGPGGELQNDQGWFLTHGTADAILRGHEGFPQSQI